MCKPRNEDIPLIRTLGAGPDIVRIRGVSLYMEISRNQETKISRNIPTFWTEVNGNDEDKALMLLISIIVNLRHNILNRCIKETHYNTMPKTC